MDSERKQQILSAERHFNDQRRMSDALADRGFYVMGKVAPGGSNETTPLEFHPSPHAEPIDNRVR